VSPPSPIEAFGRRVGGLPWRGVPSATSDGGPYALGGRFQCCDAAPRRFSRHTRCHGIPWARTIAPKPDQVPPRHRRTRRSKSSKMGERGQRVKHVKREPRSSCCALAVAGRGLNEHCHPIPGSQLVMPRSQSLSTAKAPANREPLPRTLGGQTPPEARRAKHVKCEPRSGCRALAVAGRGLSPHCLTYPA
jgi:hypothetical protein